jgi:APA family basic amino acid/polyamine antiporter
MKNKNFGFWEVFSISSGAMISSGLFVLPAVIYAMAGNDVVWGYALAGIMVFPTLFSKAELATAMPKAGGTYFFVQRSLGPLVGSFAGFAGWFSISFKGAFALMGMGAFFKLFYPDLEEQHIKYIALGLVVVFTLLNLWDSGHAGTMQNILVAGLLGTLIFFIVAGLPQTGQESSSGNFLPLDWTLTVSAAGMVFVSFGGVTKVAALAGEVKNPGKNLPGGMFASFFVVLTLYILAVFVTVEVLDSPTLSETLIPLSLAGDAVAGIVGLVLLSVGAILSFATTANAAILSASRTPYSMSKDHILPHIFKNTATKKEIPWFSILATGIFMAIVILGLELEYLVKAASTMMLILFFLDNISVILMRESRISSYRPSFKMPLYPLFPILGMAASLFLIIGMHVVAWYVAGGFIAASLIWYLIYCRKQEITDNAMIRIVERIMNREIKSTAKIKESHNPSLHEELTEILLERDDIKADRFDQLIRSAQVLDLPGPMELDELFEQLSELLAQRLDISKDDAWEKLHSRERDSTTALEPRLAIPHIVLDGPGFDIIPVRVKGGVHFNADAENVRVIFALAGARDERNFHLKCLMAIAQIMQDDAFEKDWNSARDEEELKNLILLTKRRRMG